MTTGLIIESAIKASLIFGAAWITTFAMRRASAASRHMLWMAAIVAAMAMPVLVQLAPGWGALPEVTFAVNASSAAADASGSSWVPAVPVIWLSGFVLTLAGFALAYLRMGALVARAARCGGLRETEEPVSPFVWGVWKPVIVFPRAAADWNDSLRRSVLLHEQAHISRGDAAWLAVSQLACAIYWFLPLSWFAMKKAQEEAERACDDAVLREGTGSADYAEQLLIVARGTVARHIVPAITGASPLERRVRALLDRRANRRALSIRFAVASLMACLFVTLPLAALQQDETVYPIGGDVTPPRLIYKVEPEYTQEARDARIEGSCVLTVEIHQDGIARNIVIKKSLDAGLDLNAIAAVSQWRFSPAEKDGKRVRVAATIEVNFRLL